MTVSVEQLRSLAGYIRRNATANRAVERIGPFVATFTDHSDNPFLNYAIPDDGASPSDREVAALVAACRRRGRTPRLEYFPALAPAVAPRLRAAGFAEVVAVSVQVSQARFDRVSYDHQADVLHLHVGDPGTAVDFGEWPEGHALRLDARTLAPIVAA